MQKLFSHRESLLFQSLHFKGDKIKAQKSEVLCPRPHLETPEPSDPKKSSSCVTTAANQTAGLNWKSRVVTTTINCSAQDRRPESKANIWTVFCLNILGTFQGRFRGLVNSHFYFSYQILFFFFLTFQSRNSNSLHFCRKSTISCPPLLLLLTSHLNSCAFSLVCVRNGSSQGPQACRISPLLSALQEQFWS